MVLDSDRRLGPGTVTGPLDLAGNHILRALEPLKTNDRGFRRTRLRRALYNRATEKHNLLRGWQSWTLRSERETIIDLVSTSRRDRLDRPRSDPLSS